MILLAQGRFARFLLAKNDERQALLRTLFDSHRFEHYQEALEGRRRETADRLLLENRVLAVQLENAERLVTTSDPAGTEIASGSIDERLERVGQARLRAAHARELSSAREHTATEVHAAADAEHAGLVAQRAGQKRREAARAALALLESRADAIAADRVELSRARDAEALRASMDASRRASAALETAADARDRARDAWLAAGQDEADPSALDQQAHDLSGDVGAFKVALVAEQQLDELRARRAAAGELLTAVDEELAVLDVRRAGLPVLAASLSAGIAEAAVRADTRPEAAARVAEARDRLTAAREAEACGLAVTQTQSRVAAAGRALTKASAELDDVRDRRFRGHAGELAELLTAGQPCPVCGSCDHPTPTPRGDDPITDGLVADAEAAREAAIAADSRASAALRAAEQTLADAMARAAGLSVAAAEGELATRESAERVAAAAAEERIRLELERDRLQHEAAGLAASHAELSSGRTAAASALAALDQAIASSEQTISLARGDHESVAARIAEAEHIIALARALATSERTVETQLAAAEDAARDLADRLALSAFGDAAEAIAALREQPAREKLDAGVRRYDAELALQRQTLLELELELLPEAPVDVDASAAALAQASADWRAAVAVHTEAARLAAQLDEACEAARIAHEAIAELAEEADVIERLANSVAGRAPNTLKMNLETFVLAAELEEIVAAANVRLDEMSQGRYRLQHTDSRAARGAASGLGIEVLDAYTGHARPVQSLSGGETFLASLALALGLAEVVTARAGGIRLDTLFIDEGFGSLDADTLDIAMRTLDELRQGGRVIGVISHVEAMKDQLPAQLLVETTDQGPSVIRQDATAPI